MLSVNTKLIVYPNLFQDMSNIVLMSPSFTGDKSPLILSLNIDKYLLGFVLLNPS